MIKRRLAFLLMVICLLTAVGCGGTNSITNLMERMDGRFVPNEDTVIEEQIPAQAPYDEQPIIVSSANVTGAVWETRFVSVDQLDELEWIEVELIALYGADAADRKTIISAATHARDHLKGKATFALRTYDLGVGYTLRLTGEDGAVCVEVESM